MPDADSSQPLGLRHFAVVAVVLALGLVALLAIVWPRLVEEYVLVVEAPPLERAFGFRAAYVPAGEDKEDGRVYAITDLTDDGPLARAGFQVGDWLSAGICRFYGDYVAAQAFFDELRRVRSGETVQFYVTRHDHGDYEFRQITVTPSGNESP